MNITATLLLFCAAFVLNALPVSSWAANKSATTSTSTIITYQEPDLGTGSNQEIRRREGGLAEGEDGSTVRGAVRGVTRGATRGAVRGAVRGATRGVVRGATRGAVRGAVRGATRGVTRGAVRGTTRGIPAEKAAPLMAVPSRLVVLAPLRTGLTNTAQPTLYWFVSSQWNEPLEFTLIRQGVADPIAQFSITPPQHAGSYAIDLASHHITLQAGIEYEWFVNIILDPVERSGDMFGSGTMIYQPQTSTPANSSIQHLAEHGYWYDAIHALAKKGDTTTTASLLHQQRLPLAAKWFDQQASL